MKAFCPCCRREHDLGARVSYKAVGVGLSLVGAKYIIKNPLAALAAVFGALAAGHLADRYLLPACNACGGALHALDDALSLLSAVPLGRS